MSRFAERSRGVEVFVLDLSKLEREALEYRQKDHPEPRPDCTEARIYGGPWGIVLKDDRIYAICEEGVGSEITDQEPLEVSIHGTYRNVDSKEVGSYSLDFLPFATATLTPENLMNDYPSRSVDLADFIRTFGSRLENNFWLWYDEFK